jgi:hypothetical protein
MRIHRIAVLALALFALGAVQAQARTFETGAELRKALPEPGQDALPGSVEYVGTSGDVAIALVRARGGGAVAYLCDGEGISRWLTGKATARRAKLAGTDSNLVATISGATARGTARIGGKTLRFTLEQAEPGNGLRRYTDRLNGALFEAAWISTPSGIIRGAGARRRVILLTTATTVLGDPAEEIVDRRRVAGDAAAGPVAHAALSLLTRARCAVLVVKLSSLSREELAGTLDSDDQAAQSDATDRFTNLGCAGEGGFVIP